MTSTKQGVEFVLYIKETDIAQQFDRLNVLIVDPGARNR